MKIYQNFLDTVKEAHREKLKVLNILIQKEEIWKVNEQSFQLSGRKCFTINPKILETILNIIAEINDIENKNNRED